MLAIILALGLTSPKRLPKTFKLQEIKIFCDAARVVDIINYHIKHRPDSLFEVASTKFRKPMQIKKHLKKQKPIADPEEDAKKERSMIERVIAKVRKISRWCKVSIAVSCREDEARWRARELSLTESKCKWANPSKKSIRLQRQRARNELLLQKQQVVADPEAAEATFELPIRKMESSSITGGAQRNQDLQ